MKLQIHNINEGREISRKINIDDYYFAEDVCEWLEIEDPIEVLALLDHGQKAELMVQSENTDKKEKLTLVNFSGLLLILFHSPTLQGHNFRQWVTNEVLPKIILDDDFPTKFINKKNDHHLIGLFLGSFVNRIHPLDIPEYAKKILSEVPVKKSLESDYPLP